MRLVWIVLGAGLAAACNGSDDEASSDGQELSSNTGSDRDTTGAATDSNSDGEISGPEDNREGDTASSQSEPDGGPSEGGEAGAVTDVDSDSSSGLPPGEDARIRCEAMDEQQCLDNEDDNCVPIRGARYAAQDACIESRFVRCTCTTTVSMECSSSCSDGALIVYMQDDEDELWMFPTTCTPDEWQEVASDDPMVSVFDDAAKCGGD